MMKRVLVYEEISSGGMIDQDLPSGYLAQGRAMLKASARDLQSAGLEVTVMCDHRVSLAELNGVAELEVRRGDDIEAKLIEQATQVDAVLVIAPECEGLLTQRLLCLENAGTWCLNLPSSVAVVLGDKAMHGQVASRCGIRFLPQWRLSELASSNYHGPVVVKDRLGAGGQGVFLFDSAYQMIELYERGELHARLGESFDDWNEDRFIVEKYLEDGIHASMVLAFNGQGKMLCLDAHEQRVEVTHDGRFAYRGGVMGRLNDQLILAGKNLAHEVGQGLMRSFKMYGVIGIDVMLFKDGRDAQLIEINPRMTLSFSAMQQMFNQSLHGWVLGQNNFDAQSVSEKPISYDVAGRTLQEVNCG